MQTDSRTWNPPVSFHFLVEFQWEKDKSSASFAEVDGLSQELVLKSEYGSDLPEHVKSSDLVLKRTIEPIDEQITTWVKNTFRFMYGAKIKPCTLLVSLLDEKNKPTAKWVCEWAFHIKWTVSPLNATESRIAIETLTLRYKSLRRSL